MWREAQATILYEDDPGYGNLQQYAADNLVRATPSDEHLDQLSRGERIRWRRGRESPRFAHYVLWNLVDVTQGVRPPEYRASTK